MLTSGMINYITGHHPHYGAGKSPLSDAEADPQQPCRVVVTQIEMTLVRASNLMGLRSPTAVHGGSYQSH